jgi:chemotaxis protein CheZ
MTVATQAHAAESDDLEALFDSIVAERNNAPACEPVETSGEEVVEDVHCRIGKMVRKIHDVLSEPSCEELLSKTRDYLPDTCDRLSYVTKMTEQAANRTLSATETARPLLEQIETRAESLNEQWEKLFDRKLSVDEFKTLVRDTRDYLSQAPALVRSTQSQLTEIMMAQEFQDLTGQVIKRVLSAARELESQLLQVLIETIPEEKRSAANETLSGPVIDPATQPDVLTNQKQVDELLESLGF